MINVVVRKYPKNLKEVERASGQRQPSSGFISRRELLEPRIKPMKTRVAIVFACLTAVSTLAYATDTVPPRIAWYGTLTSGLAAAKRSGRPILFISAAPQCLGVSGIW
jgi:hypothetical protein